MLTRVFKVGIHIPVGGVSGWAFDQTPIPRLIHLPVSYANGRWGSALLLLVRGRILVREHILVREQTVCMVRSLPVRATHSMGERRKIHIRGGPPPHTECLRAQIGAKCKKVLRAFDFLLRIGDGEKVVYGEHGLSEHEGVCERQQKVGGGRVSHNTQLAQQAGSVRLTEKLYFASCH